MENWKQVTSRIGTFNYIEYEATVSYRGLNKYANYSATFEYVSTYDTFKQTLTLDNPIDSFNRCIDLPTNKIPFELLTDAVAQIHKLVDNLNSF